MLILTHQNFICYGFGLVNLLRLYLVWNILALSLVFLALVWLPNSKILMNFLFLKLLKFLGSRLRHRLSLLSQIKFFFIIMPRSSKFYSLGVDRERLYSQLRNFKHKNLPTNLIRDCASIKKIPL